MKKITILIPVYNDWESLTKLLKEIDEIAEETKNLEFSCLVINDCSIVKMPKMLKPPSLKTLNIINMKKNTYIYYFLQ